MNGENINIGSKPLRVIVSPLDWGLGHATRIITIIKTLQNYDVQVLIAADGSAAALLQQEFPTLQILSVPGYKIQYAKNKRSFFWKLLSQLPGILKAINAENRILNSWAEEYQPDGIISDNRFGFYHPAIPSVYISHQLFIETGHKWLNKLAQQIHYKYINRFSECWVPDFEKGSGLAGKLSHPQQLPAVSTKYLGPLSRFTRQKENANNGPLLIILSGPEPQRSIWEAQLVKQIKKANMPCIVVRGLPSGGAPISETPFLRIYDHLQAFELQQQIEDAALIISRAGYSTVMDLVALRKKAILVPTPGQPEQEYLATYLKEQQIFFTCSQENFDLQQTLNAAKKFITRMPEEDFKRMNESVILKWVNDLKKTTA